MSHIQEFHNSTGLMTPSRARNDYVVFSVPSISPLAESICRSIERIQPQSSVCIGKIDYNTFPDGFPNIYIHDASRLSQKDIIYVCSLDCPADVFIQLSTMYMFCSYCVRSLTIVCPYIPTGTMERAQIMGEVPTAVTLAKMFGILSMPCRLLIVDLHTQHNLYYFPTHISPLFVHAIPTLLKRFQALDEDERKRISIVFPDEGASKRYRLLFDEYPQVLCSKIRRGNERIVTVIEGECKDRHVYIIDDLVHSGGTLIECAQVCRDDQSAKVSIFTTHGVFENDSHLKFVELAKQGKLDTFYVTNTHPNALKLEGLKPFVILDVADAITENI